MSYLIGLENLAQRCEQASVAGRGLDGRIAYALGWRFNGFAHGPDESDDYFDDWEEVGGHWAQPGGDFCPVSRSFSRYDYPDPPLWTASLDAAMTLVPEGWNWMAGNRDQPKARAYVNNGELAFTGVAARRNPARQWFEVVAATPALALCSAALRARAALTPSNPPIKEGE